MKILIVGAGIGGLSLASFLKDSEVEFDIIERQKELKTQGFSIGLWNNGRNMLKKLGLSEKFDQEGSKIRNYLICDGNGNILRKYNLSALESKLGVSYTHIKRESLHSWLVESVGTKRIRLGVEVNSIIQGDRVSVTFSNGEQHEYDLVVGADGIHSTIRGMCFKDSVEYFDNWRVWYTWVDKSYKRNDSVIEYIAPSQFLGIFDVHDKTLAVLIAPENHNIWDKSDTRIDNLLKKFNDISIARKIVNEAKPEEVLPTNLSNVRCKKYVSGRIVLLGDAAHGFEPHAGLGASMAMEDAYTLAAELIKQSDSPYVNLKDYETKRISRIKQARKLTNRMKYWTFIKSKWYRQFVNFLLRFIPESFFINQYIRLLKKDI